MTKPYFTIANLLLMSLAVYFGVEIFYRAGTARLETETVLEAAPSRGGASAKQPVYPFAHYQPIVDRNLFRTNDDARGEADDVDLENLEQTELKLKLLGTVTGDERSAYAVIEDEKERQQNLYKTGDSIQSAVLKRILREKVVLTVNGKDEVLEIEKLEAAGTRRGPKPSGTPTRTTASQSAAAPRIQRINLKRSVIEDATKNMNQLMKDVNIQPHFEDGKAEGLRISRISRSSIFRKMGLRRGDIITGVDGQAIQSVDDALSLYSNLKTASNVKIEIKRRGQTRVLDYNIR